MAAPAFDAASSAGGLSVATLTWSHTCTGSDRKLLAGAHHRTTGAGRVLSSVTYATVGMTQFGTRQNNGQLYTDGMELNNPATGPNDIVITFATAPSTWIGGLGISLAGAKTSEASDATGGGAGNDTAPTASLTTTVNDCMLVGLMCNGATPAQTAVAGNTVERVEQGVNADGDTCSGGSEEKATAGTETVDWAITTNPWAVVVIAVAPTTPVSTRKLPLTLLGVGS